MALEKFGMSYRNLGNSGLRASRLAIAVSSCRTPPTATGIASLIAEDNLEQLLNLAYEAGVNYFDVSDTPLVCAGRTEILFGKILKKKKWRRSSYILATKVPQRSGAAETERGLSRKHIVEAVQSSLDRLGVTYVDLILAPKRDKELHTPMEEIVRAFSYVVEKGWAFYWGTQGWTQQEVFEAFSTAKILGLLPPLLLQSPYNFFDREQVELVIPELLCIGCGSITSSPLAGGLIGEYSDTNTDVTTIDSPHAGRLAFLQDQLSSGGGDKERASFDISSMLQKIKCLRPVASQMGTSLAQLAIAWCLRSEFVQTVLVAPASLEQMRDNLGALSVLDNKMTPEIQAIIEKILANQPAINMAPRLKSRDKGLNNRRRSSVHRKTSFSSSPRLSISHAVNPYEGRFGCRDSIDYSSGYDRRPSHI